MEKISDMNKQELRSKVQESYKKVNKDRMLSNELRELLGFTEDGKARGGLIFRLMRENIVEKDSDKPVRDGAQ
jgi:hypothetical protein